MKLDFFEKPGCQGNKKQKILLQKAGAQLMVLDLLNTPWTPETLRPFFRDKLVAEWFNPSAPAVKKKEIDTSSLSDFDALELLCKNPILIRRPLIQSGEKRMSGFDEKELLELFGIDLNGTATGLDRCVSTSGEGCSTPRPLASEPRICDGALNPPRYARR